MYFVFFILLDVIVWVLKSLMSWDGLERFHEYGEVECVKDCLVSWEWVI